MQTSGNATWIASKLWQGSAPPCNTPLGDLGFDVLVLTAKEHQLSADCFPGVRVIHAELDDAGPPPTMQEIRDAHRAALEASSLWRRGARVLVTCQIGANRSGLVTALILRHALGISGREARKMVQDARVAYRQDGPPMRALSNKHFADYLDTLPPEAPPRWYLARAPRRPGDSDMHAA